MGCNPLGNPFLASKNSRTLYLNKFIYIYTPRKINIEAENDSLEDDFAFPGMHSQVPAVNLPRCIYIGFTFDIHLRSFYCIVFFIYVSFYLCIYVYVSMYLPIHLCLSLCTESHLHVS